MKKKEKITVNSSVAGTSKNKIFAPEVVSHPKYREVFDRFERLFRSNKLFLTDSFDKKVWFLKDDIFFQKIINKTDLNTNTPTPNWEDSKNKVHDILSELNENTSFSTLLVNVEKFIYRLVEVLIQAHSTIERSNITIKSFNAVERKQNIEESVKLIEDRVKKYQMNDLKSKLKVKLIKTIDFNPGRYYFTIKSHEIKQEDNNPCIYQNNYFLNKKLGLDIKQSENEHEVSNEFEEIIFREFDLNSVGKMKNNINSGSTFSFFNLLVCDNSNESKSDFKCESLKTYFLEIILNTLDNILDISKTSFTENIEIQLSRNPHQGSFEKNKVKSTLVSVILELNFEFDDLTRASILRRISNVFKEVLDTKKMNENSIDLVLDKYFETIGESVKNCLNKTMENQKDACCDCIVF